MAQKLRDEALTKKISDYLLENGAVGVVFTTKEILQDGGLISVDITSSIALLLALESHKRL